MRWPWSKPKLSPEDQKKLREAKTQAGVARNSGKKYEEVTWGSKGGIYIAEAMPKGGDPSENVYRGETIEGAEACARAFARVVGAKAVPFQRSKASQSRSRGGGLI